MRKITTLMVLFILLTVGCTKDTYQPDAPARGFPTDSPEYIFEVLQDAGVKDVSYDQVVKAMSNRSSGQPCEWDFDTNGEIDVQDLLALLAGYGADYFADDILDFLGVYGQSYILDIIPMWNNHIQDVWCSLDWQNFTKLKCGDNTSWLPLTRIDSIQWIHNDSIVGTDPYELDWKSYPLESMQCSDTLGYQPPCNGLQTVTQRLFINGHSYLRTNTGYALMNNVPDTIPSCEGNAFDIENFPYLGSDYDELEFLEE